MIAALFVETNETVAEVMRIPPWDMAVIRKFRDDCSQDYATGDGPVPSSALLSVLDKLLAAAGGGG